MRAPTRRRLNSARLLSIASNIVAEALEGRTLLTASLSGTTLEVTGTTAADTFTLSDSGSTITVKQGASTFTFADSSVTKTVVNPTAGGDKVSVLSNTKPIAITGGGLDTVNIGSATNSLTGIKSTITVTNPTSHTILNVNDTGDSTTGPVPPTVSSSAITGFSPGAIDYTASQLSALNVTTSLSNVTVTSTGILASGGHTLVDNSSADGVDSPGTVGVDVLTTSGPLSVNSYDLGVGNAGSAQAIHGVITFVATFSGEVGVDDSADTTGRTIVDLGGSISGISPALINYSGDVRFEDLSGGTGNDSFNIADGSPDEGTQINGGGGNDSLVAGEGTFSNKSDAIYFDGGTGTNSVTADDSLASDSTDPQLFTGVDTFHLNQADANWISSGETLVFINAQKASLLLGSGNDTMATDPSFAVPLVVHGGAGNDSLVGGTGNDSLFGDAGNDTLNGEAGNDLLNGGTGTDVLQASTGIDSLDGGDGAPVQIVADNVANPISGTSQGVTLTGAWSASTFTLGFWGSNYVTDGNTAKGTKSVKFTPTIPVTGSYQVYARWTAASNRSTSVPFDVLHQGVTTTLSENQQLNNVTWVLLGTFTLNAGTSSSVTIRNPNSGFVVADAVRFVPVTATATISGTVFNDANGNGVLNAGEAGIPGRVVYIDSNKDGLLDNGERSTTTDAAGYWALGNLTTGTYRIRDQNVAGVHHTDPSASANFYDVAVTSGATASAIYGKLFGEQVNPASTAPKFRINAGGPAFLLNSGVTFTADSGFTGGTAATTVYDVANTDNDPLYYSYRSGASFSYAIAVPNGNYNLILNFADPTSTAAGQRKFNVTAEGKTILSNFDIVATGGVKAAVTKTIAVTVTDGVLNLTFTGVVGSAIVSGIQLFPT